MNNEIGSMLAGQRPRSNVYKALRMAFNAFAVAVLFWCVAVALRDLVGSHLWHARLLGMAEIMFGIGFSRIVFEMIMIFIGFSRNRFANRSGN